MGRDATATSSMTESIMSAQGDGHDLVAASPREIGFRRLLEATSIIQWEADARTRDFTYVGSQAERLLGFPLDEWYQPAFWLTRLHPDDRERVLRFREEALVEREAYELEYRMVGAHGEVLWLHDVVADGRGAASQAKEVGRPGHRSRGSAQEQRTFDSPPREGGEAVRQRLEPSLCERRS